MNSFGMLYCYEVKKILSRKMAWIVFLICAGCIILFITADLTGKYYVDGEVVDTHYHMFRVDQAYYRALSGRVLDQELLSDMSEAYRKIPVSEERYTLTEEYQTYARPYSEIFHLVRLWTQQSGLSEIREWEPDIEALYAARADNLEKEWTYLQLSDTEKNFWREKEAQINKPILYFYHDGYSKIISNGFNTVGLLVIVFVCICMASVFTEEHTRRTDQLILSSAKGRNMVYWAKLAAGISVSTACIVLLLVLMFVLVFVIYGAEGFQAALQLCAYMWSSSYTLTIGQVCLIACGILTIIVIFTSVLVLVLSEVLHSNIATLAVCVGMIMAGMVVNIPNQYRVLSQFWDWCPTRFYNAQYAFDTRLLTVFGHCFVSWKVVPVIYILIGLAVVLTGNIVYRNYQVSGR